MTRNRTHFDGPYGTDRSPSDLERALADGRIPTAVYGLGKMGLPLATVFARRTGRVVGVDTDPSVVAAVNEASSPVVEEPGLSEALEAAVEDGSLRATTDGETAASDARLHVVIVPTLVDDAGNPDLSALEAVTETIAVGLEPGDLVVIESTVPPRTCSDLVLPHLVAESGHEAGSFGLAFCPERTASGTALQDIRGSYPKVVGGVDNESTRCARAVYEVVTDNDVVTVSDATTAECVKVFEGVYRDVNIALANELGTLADELGVDTLEAIDAANTQPFCDLHEPGAGVGGHCIPIYPQFLIGGCETRTPLMATARKVNDGMASFVVERLAEGLARRDEPLAGARVAVLGVTYRPGVDEIRESPAIPIAGELTERGATVHAVDPICSSMDAVPGEPTPVDALPELDLDGVVLVTGHDTFREIPWSAFDSLVVVDGRQFLSIGEYDHTVYTVGKGFRNTPAERPR